MAQQQKHETRVANYYNSIVPVMQATEIVNAKTGEVVTPSIYDKLIYCYILHYHDLYSAKGNGMFESQDSIADNFGIDRKTVNRSIKKLTTIGLLSKNVVLEVKGNTKRKHATYFPYDVRIGNDFTFIQKVVVRDEQGVGVEQCFHYSISPVQSVKLGVVEEKKEEDKPAVSKTEDLMDHPAFVDIPYDDEEFEQIQRVPIKTRIIPTLGDEDPDAPF